MFFRRGVWVSFFGIVFRVGGSGFRFFLFLEDWEFLVIKRIKVIGVLLGIWFGLEYCLR